MTEDERDIVRLRIPKEQAVREATAKLIATATPILHGLLASGHYTEINTEMEPKVLRWDAGARWKEDHTQKHIAFAVDDALSLARELLARATQEIREELDA